ncbi:uncharacterized protein G2W53_021368 [Senna tora]|uniref:Uncharacterized protein n=1 Tax=Senna tora TaxID=362788 RepID=A0A834TLA6_9FABA|nr:uncharacterized protein G2W53_021368 [Senna tora]
MADGDVGRNRSGRRRGQEIVLEEEDVEEGLKDCEESLIGREGAQIGTFCLETAIIFVRLDTCVA